MKRLLIIIVALLLLPFGASSKGVTYFKGTIYEALDAASRANKLLLVEFYASWSYKSQWARDNMMTGNDLLGDFVVFSVDATSKEGASLAATYEVFEYPNILIFSKTGAVLDRISRTMDRADFTARLSQTLLATDGYSTIQLRQIYLAATKENNSKELNALVRNYLSSFNGRSLDISAVMDLFTSSSINYYQSAAFEYMLANQPLFDSVFVQQRVSSLLIEALIPYISGIEQFDSLAIGGIVDRAENFHCHPMIEKLSQFADLRAKGDEVGFVQLLDNVINNISPQYQYPLIMSLDFVDVTKLDKSIKKIALRVIDKLASTNVSQAKNVVIESLRVKFL